MAEEKKENKESKSYALRPSQIKWLRRKALEESTAEETVSASAVLERIVDQAMEADKQAHNSNSKKNALTARDIPVAA